MQTVTNLIDIQLDASAAFVVREDEATKDRSTWFYADGYMEDGDKVGLLIQAAPFVESVDYQLQDPAEEGEMPVVFEDGKRYCDLDWFLEVWSAGLLSFVKDPQNIDAWTIEQ